MQAGYFSLQLSDKIRRSATAAADKPASDDSNHKSRGTLPWPDIKMVNQECRMGWFLASERGVANSTSAAAFNSRRRDKACNLSKKR